MNFIFFLVFHFNATRWNRDSTQSSRHNVPACLAKLYYVVRDRGGLYVQCDRKTSKAPR